MELRYNIREPILLVSVSVSGGMNIPLSLHFIHAKFRHKNTSANITKDGKGGVIGMVTFNLCRIAKLNFRLWVALAESIRKKTNAID